MKLFYFKGHRTNSGTWLNWMLSSAVWLFSRKSQLFLVSCILHCAGEIRVARGFKWNHWVLLKAPYILKPALILTNLMIASVSAASLCQTTAGRRFYFMMGRKRAGPYFAGTSFSDPEKAYNHYWGIWYLLRWPSWHLGPSGIPRNMSLSHRL